MDTETILRTDGLTKQFGSFTAVDSVDIAVQEGEIRSIIGPNGAGKTTLFNLLSGLFDVTSGVIEYRDTDITEFSPAKTAKLGIARSFQVTNIFDSLSVEENVKMIIQRSHLDEMNVMSALFRKTTDLDEVNERADEILDLLDLTEVREKPASALSHGNQRRLELGMALGNDPELLLLDEPTAGMASSEKEKTVQLIQEVLAEKTVLLVEHDINLVMDISDTITVLNQGEVIAEGDKSAITSDTDVREAYLGKM